MKIINWLLSKTQIDEKIDELVDTVEKEIKSEPESTK
jgi:hypoxanthine-guanine phosphoribosyltransferase